MDHLNEFGLLTQIVGATASHPPPHAHSLTPACLAFRTQTELEVGELLELKMLVQGSGMICLLGQVEWTLGLTRGGCRGEILLQPCPVQTPRLRRHLQLLREGCRA